MYVVLKRDDDNCQRSVPVDEWEGGVLSRDDCPDRSSDEQKTTMGNVRSLETNYQMCKRIPGDRKEYEAIWALRGASCIDTG